MADKSKRWAVTIIIIAGNLIWWFIPSNVTYLVFQSRDVLLGRYSVDRLVAMIIIAIFSLPAIYMVWLERKNRKEYLFKIGAIFLGLIAGLIVLDIAVRLIRTPRYIRTDNVYHRIPQIKQMGIFKDIPENRKSYPRILPGHPDVKYTLTIDKRGFRNTIDLERYDVLVLGDSFAEGSKVSDNQIWPFLYGVKSGRSVYNLGMSGGNPNDYLETLQKFGIQLSPDIVLCMLFEGNDFRGSGQIIGRVKRKSSFKQRLRSYIKTSPVRSVVLKFLINNLSMHRKECLNIDNSINNNSGQVNAAVFGESDIFSWFPLAVTVDSNSKYYAFDVKKLLEHYKDKQTFADSDGCKTVFLVLNKIKEICKKNNFRFIVLYAPDKPHVIMPLFEQKLSAQKVRSFLALKKKNLPSPQKTKSILYKNLNAEEDVIREFCNKDEIEFVSLTQRLRSEIQNGRQAYYTYDQHWTPIGHQVVAEVLYDYLR